MRVRFRIVLYRKDKRLKKSDLLGMKEPFWVALRYVTEFKYLEATKWLLVSEDSWEKYTLLALINLSFGQREQAEEFMDYAHKYQRKSDIEIRIEKPEEGISIPVIDLADLRSYEA